MPEIPQVKFMDCFKPFPGSILHIYLLPFTFYPVLLYNLAMESPPDGPRFYEGPDRGVGGGSFGHEEEEADRAAQEMEARYGQAREEDYAKRDRVLNRLTSAETPRDVAAALEVIKDYENVHYGESIDRFTFGAYKRAAVEGQRAFEKGSKGLRELKDLGIVSEDAEIDSDGDLVKGKVRASGYAIGVREVRGEEKPRTITKVRYTVDPQTGKRGVPEVVEETESNGMPKEVVHFGTAAERLALARAYEELHKILITSELLQNQTILFDQTRAALESAVKYFYQNQEYFTNLQTKWFFTAADIGEITPGKPENRILGDQRDKAMRLYYLVGMSETREKMEDHLNSTFNLEEILDYKKDEKGDLIDPATLDRVIDLAKLEDEAKRAYQQKHSKQVVGLGISGLEKDKKDMTPEEKFQFAAQFLIGRGLKFENGKWTLGEWLDRDTRDPTKRKDAKEKIKRGEKAADYERHQDLRGYLTAFGNPYIEDSRDKLYVLMERFSKIVGNEMAVTEAGRYFWTRGMRDELGMEVYSFRQNDKGEWVPNLPSGEDLLTYYNTHNFEEWQNYCSGDGDNAIEKRYKIPGEPVGSDLSKLFHTKMWRLKEMMKDRSAGPYLTYDKIERLTQSMFSLCRIKVETGENDGDGKPVTEYRSIREAWLGFKPDGKDPKERAEPALDLGYIDWEQSSMPEDVARALAGGGAEISDEEKKAREKKIEAERGELNESAVRDNNEGYFWTMNYLAGDDNISKRPWQFIMKGVERSGDLARSEAYTDKIKFWKIIWHGPAVAWGNWRGVYRDARVGNQDKPREDQVDAAEKALDKKAITDLNEAKRHWFDGLRSTHEYASWATQKVAFGGYVNGKPQSGTTDLINIVEGIDKGRPGLAVKYGYMDSDKIGKAPPLQMKFPL